MNELAIGRTVRWARKRSGMTQHDLAAAVGMPQPSIARIERGKVIPRTTTLEALLRATGYQVAVEPIGPPVDLDAIRRRRAKSIPARTWEAIRRPIARDRRASPLTILHRLRAFAVPFVLVGELAEVSHGSPAMLGRVVEIVHPDSDLARERLQRTLDDLRATNTARLIATTETGAGDAYDVLVRTAVRMFVDAGILVQVASVEDLIRIRQARRTETDAEAAAILQALRDEPPSVT